jgi:hypothetical protein
VVVRGAVGDVVEDDAGLALEDVQPRGPDLLSLS